MRREENVRALPGLAAVAVPRAETSHDLTPHHPAARRLFRIGTQMTATSARAAGSAVVIAAVLVSCNEEFHFDVHPDADGGGADGGGGGDSAATAAPCTTDATCAGIRCDAPSGTCVQCTDKDDCNGSLSHCEGTTHVCVACLAKTDCAKREDCDATTHRCIDSCFDADDTCPGAGFSCNEDLGLCVECTSSANCSASSSGPICDIPIGRCVQCTGNAQCPAATPVCDLRSGQCQECVVSATCGDSAICDPSTLTCRGRS